MVQREHQRKKKYFWEKNEGRDKGIPMEDGMFSGGFTRSVPEDV